MTTTCTTTTKATTTVADALCRLADDWEQHSRESLDDIERHVFNPVNYFRMAKRFTVDWQEIVERYFSPQQSQRTLPQTHLTSTPLCTAPGPDLPREWRE